MLFHFVHNPIIHKFAWWYYSHDAIDQLHINRTWWTQARRDSIALYSIEPLHETLLHQLFNTDLRHNLHTVTTSLTSVKCTFLCRPVVFWILYFVYPIFSSTSSWYYKYSKVYPTQTHFIMYTYSFSGGSEDYSSPVYASSMRPSSNESLRGTVCRLPANFLKVWGRVWVAGCIHYCLM